MLNGLLLTLFVILVFAVVYAISTAIFYLILVVLIGFSLTWLQVLGIALLWSLVLTGLRQLVRP